MAVFILKQSLKPPLYSAQRLGGYRYYIIIEEILSNSLIEQTRLTQRHQSLWPCVYNPASSIIMNRRWQQSWTGVCNNHDSKLSSFYNPTVFGNDKIGKFCIFKPVEYHMSISRPIFLKPALWKPIQVDYFLQYFSTRDQCEQIDSEAGLLTRIFSKEVSGFFALAKFEHIC